MKARRALIGLSRALGRGVWLDESPDSAPTAQRRGNIPLGTRAPPGDAGPCHPSCPTVQLYRPQMEATKGFDNGRGMFHTVRLAEGGVDGGSGVCPADFERERIPTKRGLPSVSMKE